MKSFMNKKTLIIGEVNTGKSAHLCKLIEEFIRAGENDLTVIDMAPEKVKGIGGKLNIEGHESIRYFTAPIMAPRLTGKTPQEVQALAEENARVIDEIFIIYLKKPSEILFINDVSIYLQAGDLEKLQTYISSTPTVIMNGYFGSTLGGGTLGERERRNMEELRKRCDRVIKKTK